MTKIGLLFANYGPYHLARLDGLAKHCRSLGWQPVGIELTRSGIAYDWETPIEEFPVPVISVLGQNPPEAVKFGYLLQRLGKVLSEVDPDVVAIAGYFRPAMLAALSWCLWHGKPTILLSESKEDDAQRNLWQETAKSLILKGYKAALVGGQPQKRYLMKLGIPADAIFCGYNVVGNEVFHPDKIRTIPRPIARPYFLAINRFIPKKNILRLLSSYAEYRHQSGDMAWDLVLCGDGPMRYQVEQHITQLNIQNSVHLPGFLQQAELLPYFAHASCFIHASIQEQWGLVVNEAMAAGLPVLVSTRCGCVEDLVIEGINGFSFDPENSPELTDLMLKFSSGIVDANQMGSAALEHIQKFSPDYFATGLIQAVKYATATS